MRFLIACLLLISGVAYGQSYTPINGNQRFVGKLGIPVKDTFAWTQADSAVVVLRPADSLIWFKYKGPWRVIGSGGGGSLPSQTGNARKFLTTDGTNASWGLPNFADSVDYTGSSAGMYLRINPAGSGLKKYDFANVGGINTLTGFSPIIVTGSGTTRDIKIDTSYATGVKTNLRATNDSAVLAAAINAKPNFGDVRSEIADSLVTVVRKSDSTLYSTKANVTKAKDSVVALLSNYIASGSSASLQNLSISGTNGNGFIHLKHQASDATTPASSSVLFANSSGYMKWKNDGGYYSTLAMPQTANRTYTFQDKSYTLADDAVTVKYTDTTNRTTGVRGNARAINDSNLISKKTQPVIGNVYFGQNFTSLSDFNTSGTFTLDSGRIKTPTNGQGFGKYLSLKTPTKLENKKVTLSFKYKGYTSGDSSIWVGYRSSNTTVASSAYGFVKFLSSTTAVAGMVSTYPSNNYNISSTQITIATNDIITVEFGNINGGSFCKVTNNTNGQTSIAAISNLNRYSFISSGFDPNTSTVAVIPATNTQHEIISLQYECFDLVSPTNLLCGDSISDGSFAGTIYNRFGSISNMVISAGGGDKTAELLSRTDEIINVIKPKNVYIQIGVNDLIQGVADTVWQRNDTAINGRLTRAGINVIWIAPPASNATDVSVIKTYLDATFPQVIDNYTSTKTTTGTNLKPYYDAGDGTHLNAAGNVVMYKNIVTSSYYEPSPVFTKTDLSIYSFVGTGGTTTSPAGSSTNIQYNSSGSFAGSNNFVWDNSNVRLGVGTSSPSQIQHLKSSAPAIRFENTTTNQTYDFGVNVNSFGHFFLKRQDGTNNNTQLDIQPLGTGLDIGGGVKIGGQLLVWSNSDLTNYNFCVLTATNTQYNIKSYAGGTSTVLPIGLDATTASTANQILLNTNGTVSLSSLGTGTVYSNSGVLTNTNPSDSRLKNSIKPLNYGLDAVLKLQPKSFYYNSDSVKSNLTYGLIAQDVQKVIPEIVRKVDDKYLGIKSEDLVPILINAIQELNKKIEALEKKIK